MCPVSNFLVIVFSLINSLFFGLHSHSSEKRRTSREAVGLQRETCQGEDWRLNTAEHYTPLEFSFTICDMNIVPPNLFSFSHHTHHLLQLINVLKFVLPITTSIVGHNHQVIIGSNMKIAANKLYENELKQTEKKKKEIIARRMIARDKKKEGKK